jgi:hypothetical protein
VGGAQHFQFQQPQLAVGDDEDVAAAAGGVEEGERAQLLVEVEQFVAVVADFSELGPQRIQEQRLDELENVFFAGVSARRGCVAPCRP